MAPGFLRKRLKRASNAKGSTKNLVGNSNPDPAHDEMRRLLKEVLDEGTELDAEVFETYRVEEELGQGSFSRVFRGIEKGSGKECAIKIVSMRAIGDKAVHDAEEEKLSKGMKLSESEKIEIERKAKLKVVNIMVSEIAVMKRISHISAKKRKYLVDLHKVVANEKRICVVMDLCNGGELFDRILDRTRYTEKDASIHFKHTMLGLKYLHKAGIVHRDLKPENLVFLNDTENSTIKIADFGLALIMGYPDMHCNSIVGSAAYIAPEVIEHKRYTPACDVWAMGVILYTLCVGKNPFTGRSNRDLFKNVVRGEFTYPKSAVVSSMCQNLIKRMLHKDPTKRIKISSVLNHPWVLQKSASADFNIAVNNLTTFNTKRKLKAMTNALVWGTRSGLRKDLYRILEGTPKASGFTGEELIRIRDALFKYKSFKCMTFEQFEKVMTELNYQNLPLLEIYDLFDTNGSNSADVAEVVIGISTAAESWDGDSQMQFCFETYDQNGAGTFGMDDFKKVFNILAIEMEQSVGDKLASMFYNWTPRGVDALMSPDDFIDGPEAHEDVIHEVTTRRSMKKQPSL